MRLVSIAKEEAHLCSVRNPALCSYQLKEAGGQGGGRLVAFVCVL
jgi:hypothetical protein